MQPQNTARKLTAEAVPNSKAGQAPYDIIHHGAINGVTGSCHELRASENEAILIDCGLFQGLEAEFETTNNPMIRMVTR